MKKKYLLITICTLSISVFSSDTKNEISNLGTMLLIHKTPTCGCCKEWVKHVKENGGPGRTRTYDQWIMSPLL